MASDGAGAAAARLAFVEQAEAKGHVTDNARAAAAGLEAAFAAGVLVRTPTLDLMLADLGRALEQDDGPAPRGQERRGGPVHPPCDIARAGQRLSWTTQAGAGRPAPSARWPAGPQARWQRGSDPCIGAESRARQRSS